MALLLRASPKASSVGTLNFTKPHFKDSKPITPGPLLEEARSYAKLELTGPRSSSGGASFWCHPEACRLWGSLKGQLQRLQEVARRASDAAKRLHPQTGPLRRLAQRLGPRGP